MLDSFLHPANILRSSARARVLPFSLIACLLTHLVHGQTLSVGQTSGPPYFSPGVFNVLRYGADGTGATDSSPAVQAAVDAAVAADRGGIVYFPAGEYRLASTITATLTSPEKSLIFQGDAPELSLLFSAGAHDGIQVNLQVGALFDGDKGTVGCNNLSIKTDQEGGFSAFVLAGSASVSPVKSFRNMLLAGRDINGYWGRGLDLSETPFTTIEDFKFQGPTSGYGGTAIDISSDSGATDFHIRGCHVWHAGNFLRVRGGSESSNGPEGIHVHQVTVIISRRGINWETTGSAGVGKEPALFLTGSHFNCTDYCIQGVDLIQSKISGNLLYQDTTYLVADWAGIRLSSDQGAAQNDMHTIVDNTIHGFSDAPNVREGVVLDGVGHSVISGNRIHDVTTGVLLRPGTVQNQVIRNYVTTFDNAPVVDQGSGNNVVP